MQVCFVPVIWEPMLKTFRPTEVKIMVALGLLADGRSRNIEFRTDDLVRVSGIARLTAQKCLKALQSKGVIKILAIRSGAGGTTTVDVNQSWIHLGGR